MDVIPNVDLDQCLYGLYSMFGIVFNTWIHFHKWNSIPHKTSSHKVKSIEICMPEINEIWSRIIKSQGTNLIEKITINAFRH